MLALNSSERWRVESVRFSSFVRKSMFSGVSLTILLSQFISIISLTREVSLVDHAVSVYVRLTICVPLSAAVTAVCVPGHTLAPSTAHPIEVGSKKCRSEININTKISNVGNIY
jgi:hypothetical protein